MGAFECPAVGSSVFSSPLVELITWGEASVSVGWPTGHRPVLSLVPHPTAAVSCRGAAPGGGTAPPALCEPGAPRSPHRAAGRCLCPDSGCSASVPSTPKQPHRTAAFDPLGVSGRIPAPGNACTPCQERVLLAASSNMPSRHGPTRPLAPRRPCHGHMASN